MAGSKLETTSNIAIRRVEPDSEICNLVRDSLLADLSNALGDYKYVEIPPEARPWQLPPDSIVLVAEASVSEGSLPELAGSVALIPLPTNGALTCHLPENVKVEELKHVITLPAFKRRGIASQLMRAVEEIAKSELGIELLVLETLVPLTWAQSFYEAQTWQRRGVYGWYDEQDSVCYEKWLR